MNKRLLSTTIHAARLLKGHADVASWCPIGSALIEGVDPQDYDCMVLLKPGIDPMSWWPTRSTVWEPCSDYDAESGEWRAIREFDADEEKLRLNFIVTSNKEQFARSITASEVCEALRITEKRTRIVVWRIVRDGFDVESALEAGKAFTQ